jgi:hypothetical protein
MEIQPLMVYSIQADAPLLIGLQKALDDEGHPMVFGVNIAGDAEGEALVGRDWDAIFVRWKEPESHEIAVLERELVAEDADAKGILRTALESVAQSDDEAGVLIVKDHLQKTQAIYALELMPTLMDNDEHPGWEGLDTLLRALAEQTEGLVYAQGEGFCAADGELLLIETPDDETYYETTTGRNGTHEHPTETPRW